MSSVGSFTETTAEPFGTFDGVAFLRHTGFFEGETSLDDYRVPFEIVAPEDPSEGSGSVLVLARATRDRFPMQPAGHATPCSVSRR